MKATVTFKRCVQNSQEFGSDDEHMVSRVWLSVEVGGQVYDELHVDLKQPVGADYEKDPLEVGKPQGYGGPYNHQEFCRIATDYYRRLVGSGGHGIRISRGAKNIRMRDQFFGIQQSYVIVVEEESLGW